MSATDDNSVFVVCDGPQIEATGPEHNPIEDWVTIIPDGYVTSERGNVVLDAEAAAEVIRKYEARGNDILIDYEHQSRGN